MDLMSGPEGNSSFCFPRGSMFPSTSGWETSKIEGKQNLLFPKGQETLSVLLYSDRNKKKEDELTRVFAGDSSVETSKQNTKSVTTTLLVAFCIFAESFLSIRSRISSWEDWENCVFVSDKQFICYRTLGYLSPEFMRHALITS